MIFRSPIVIDVINFKRSESWKMYSVDDDFQFNDQDIYRIKAICNEPLVYQWLFKEKLNGKPYSIEKAEGFIKWAQTGWIDQKYFVFIVRDINGVIQAAVDIKSNNFDLAEVGYWASGDKPGIMTNAIQALIGLATEAGYKRLFSDIQQSNEKSINVVKRCGFNLDKSFIKDGKNYYRYSIKLSKLS